jgi:hypothetical protein
MASIPRFAIVSTTSGSRQIATSALDMRSMIGRGVPAGAN